MRDEIVIVKSVGKPRDTSSDELIRWFCRAFGLTEKPEDMEPKLLKAIVHASFAGKGITSKELYKMLEEPRSTIIYHLNRLIETGVIVRKGRRYYLRSADMQSTIEELQADMMREFERFEEYAEKLDSLFEADNYGREKRKLKRAEK
ncbi:MAG: hypothetical protein ACP5K9_02295 [Candidatus Micrarchaeia archaeon]